MYCHFINVSFYMLRIITVLHYYYNMYIYKPILLLHATYFKKRILLIKNGSIVQSFKTFDEFKLADELHHWDLILYVFDDNKIKICYTEDEEYNYESLPNYLSAVISFTNYEIDLDISILNQYMVKNNKLFTFEFLDWYLYNYLEYDLVNMLTHYTNDNNYKITIMNNNCDLNVVNKNEYICNNIVIKNT